MLQLTVALTKDPRLEPLIDGTVKPQNIQLEFVLSSPGEIHYRNLKFDEFDVFQMSISEFIMVKDRGDGSKWQWSGLPIFPSKAFVWLNLLVNTRAEIDNLGDLKGKRIGVSDYPMTAALWMRIFLKELHGIYPRDISWFNGRTKACSHGVIFGLDKNPPAGVSITWLAEDQTLDVMLDRGELDAAYGFLTRPPHEIRDFKSIDRYGGTSTTQNPRMRRLFTDGGHQIITQYYKKTGILPSNHMFAVQSRILNKYPWVALELYKAFRDAKEVAFERAKRLRSTYLLFEGEDSKKQAAIFGEDPYPMGVEKNRKMIETLLGGSYEQGLTKKLGRIEEIFYPTTMDT